MKKTNKILGGLFAVLLVGTLTTKAVKAETLDGLGSEGKDATVQTVLESDVYSVDIKWGSMRFTFEKVSDDNYRWIPKLDDDNKSSNYVEITNNSTKDIKASMTFNESIDTVGARFSYSSKTEGKGTCQALESVMPTLWSDEGTNGGYRMSSNHEQILYSDSECNTYVETGTTYDSSKTYYMVSLDSTSYGYIASSVIKAPVVYDTAPFSVVGQIYSGMGRKLATKGTFDVSLYGGNATDVKAAYNTEAKKIGTVTVSITDAE